MNIRKRDGRIKEYDNQRIKCAVEKAFIDVYGSINGHQENIYLVVSSVASVLMNIEKDIIDIENIQDLVQKALYKYDRKVYKSYKEYREYRNEERIKRSKKERFYNEILNCSNIDNDNANVNQHSFSGRKYRIADYEQKEHALRNLISKKSRKAFEEGLIYHHDLSSYSIGEHNCLFADNLRLLSNGFKTRNGDVRPANSFSTACQQLAVIFQIQSQSQFGGVASCGIDWELEPFVHKSFIKKYKEGWFEKYNEECRLEDKDINIDSDVCKSHEKAYDYAIRHLEKEGKQATQGLYHNLNTLESRAGSQVPFTSINFGRNTSTYGRLISKWLLDASIEGIGKYNATSIFPIGIYQYKRGVNDKEGTPNYDLKMKAIKSMCMRIYPNWVNGDWQSNIEDENDYTTFASTMGCRTMIGKDIHTGSYSKIGRGNISPITIILPKLGLDYGTKLEKRDVADLEGFWKALDETLIITRDSLIDRYEYICNQSIKSSQFMYENGTIMDYDKCVNSVREAMKHGTNGIGIIGMAECLIALFGKHHGECEESYKFALEVVKHIDTFCTNATQEYQMNFSTYFTPAESLCKTARNTLALYYGEVEGVTDRPYLTNSIHIPVWFDIDAYSKMILEAPFTKYGKAGCITYVELSTNAVNNPKGIEKLIDFGMSLGIPYLAFNFPIDTCQKCGYSSQIKDDMCPVCGSESIQRLKRVTGYLTTDYRNFNEGKIAEVNDRVTHEKFNQVIIPSLEVAKNELLLNGIEIPKL